MAENDKNLGKQLEDIGRRLDKVKEKQRAARGEPARDDRRGRSMGKALRLGTELLSAVAVGGFIGWALDKWLDSSPLFLLIFFALGVAAGIMNVVRAAQQIQRDEIKSGMDRGRDLPPDDEDDD